MASYNRVILMGNLTRDPQLSYLPNQTPACEIGLAVNHKWRDAQGNNKEDVCFIDCRVYGKQAETANKYLTKGKPVLVEGRLQFSMWEKDGVKHSKHRVIIDRFQMLGQPGPGGAGGAMGAGAPRPQQQRPQAAPAGNGGGDDGEPQFEEPPAEGDNIPF